MIPGKLVSFLLLFTFFSNRIVYFTPLTDVMDAYPYLGLHLERARPGRKVQSQPSVTAGKFVAVFLLGPEKLYLLKMSPSLFKGSWLEGGCSWYTSSYSSDFKP